MSVRICTLAGFASLALSAVALVAGRSDAHATPSIPIPPPINFRVAPHVLTPTIKPVGPCTACSPTLPLPPPRGGLIAR